MAQSFAHLSDPHLSTLESVRRSDLLSKRFLSYLSWRRKRRFEHRPEVLNALVSDLKQQSCSQVVISGDLTHAGLPDEFVQVRRWLEQLGTGDDVAIIPGNHDSLVATPWEDTYQYWAPYFSSDPCNESETDQSKMSQHSWPSLRRRGDIVFIGLSSALPTPPLMATGHVDSGQLDSLAEHLQTFRDAFRVVYVHHSPIVGAEKWRKRLRNATALAAVIAEHGAELVLHGHGHRQRWHSLASQHGEVPVLAVPSASAQGRYGADPAGYNLYRVERGDQGWLLNVESRRLNAGGQSFGVAEQRDFVLTRENHSSPQQADGA